MTSICITVYLYHHKSEAQSTLMYDQMQIVYLKYQIGFQPGLPKMLKFSVIQTSKIYVSASCTDIALLCGAELIPVIL